MESFDVEIWEETQDSLSVEVTSSKRDQGFEHETGTGTTPEGQPIWARPHMFITGEDADLISQEFEFEWKRSAA